MPRRLSVPSYRLHKSSGQAVVTLPDGLGGRRDFLLGAFGTASSRVAYDRKIIECQAAGHQLCPNNPESELTINELILGFWKHANQNYRRPDGTHTSEIGCLKLALKDLKRLYGRTLAEEFRPLLFKAVRQAMVDRGWCRRSVNLHCSRIRGMFRWRVEQELVTESVLASLKAVKGLPPFRAHDESEIVGELGGTPPGNLRRLEETRT